MTTNVYEAAARQAKVSALAEVIGDLPASVVESFDGRSWLEAARRAGTRPPSPQTIALVVAVYRDRMGDAR